MVHMCMCEMARLDLYTVHEIHIWVWDTLATQLHAGSVACMHDFGLVCCVCVHVLYIYILQGRVGLCHYLSTDGV